MADNRALQLLEEVDSLQADGIAANQRVQQLQEARAEFEPRDVGEPGGVVRPESLATAVGAGWLLGPIGGLLMGAAQGLLARRAEKGALDAYLEDTQTMQKINEINYSALDEAAMDAQSPEDLDIVNGLQTRYDAAVEAMMSENPQVSELGRSEYEKYQTDFAKYRFDNETQRIEDEASMDAETLAMFKDLKTDFRADTGNFFAQVQTADNVLEALNRGDGASMAAALASMPLLINPAAGATTEGEVAIWQGVDGVISSLLGRVERELGSGGMRDETRKDVIKVAEQYKRNAIAWQQHIEADYGKKLVSEGIPQERWQYFNKTSDLPGYEGGGFIYRNKVEGESEDLVGSVVDNSVIGLAGDVAESFERMNENLQSPEGQAVQRDRIRSALDRAPNR